jgi:hypothetical protein
MNTLIKRALQGAVIAGGLWILGTGMASADTTPSTTGITGLVNQVTWGLTDGGLLNAPVNVPVTVCGNSVGLLGSGTAGCPATGTGSGGSAAGSTADAPISVPISVTGNSIGIAGTNSATATSVPTVGSAPSTGSPSGLLGTDVSAPVSAPITACGNAVGLLGSSTATCPAGGTQASALSVAGIDLPVSLPVTVCGNSVGLLGGTSASCSPAAANPPVTPVPPVVPPIVPDQPVVPQNPGGGLAFLSAGVPLAYTGASVRSALAIALGLLFGGVTLALAAVRRTGTASV